MPNNIKTPAVWTQTLCVLFYTQLNIEVAVEDRMVLIKLLIVIF